MSVLTRYVVIFSVFSAGLTISAAIVYGIMKVAGMEFDSMPSFLYIPGFFMCCCALALCALILYRLFREPL